VIKPQIRIGENVLVPPADFVIKDSDILIMLGM
jgi:hypothetical protein